MCLGRTLRNLIYLSIGLSVAWYLLQAFLLSKAAHP